MLPRFTFQSFRASPVEPRSYPIWLVNFIASIVSVISRTFHAKTFKFSRDLDPITSSEGRRLCMILVQLEYPLSSFLRT